MEPVEAKIKYIIHTRVVDIGEMSEVVSGKKVGDETILTTENRGYFVLFDGSRERLFLGWDEPRIKKGDKIKITIERIDDERLQSNAQASTNPGKAPSSAGEREPAREGHNP